jgi:hypothetical protein
VTQGLFIQDPAEVEPYDIDWTEALAGDTIASSTWTATPSAGVMLSSTAMTGASTKVTMAGLTLGQVYRLENMVTTAAGKTLVDDFTVRAFAE